MVHETKFMKPEIAMTCGLDVQLWVGWMEIKGHFVSQDVIAFLVPWVISCEGEQAKWCPETSGTAIQALMHKLNHSFVV